MTTQCVRVETQVAGSTNKQQLAHLGSMHCGDVWQNRLSLSKGDSAALAPPVLLLHEQLGLQLARWVGRRQGPRFLLGSFLAEQQARPKNVEAVPPSGPVYGLGNPVQRLGVGVGDGVVEVRQNLLAPVLHRGQQNLEVGLHVVRHAGWVCIEGRYSLLLWQVVKVVERLLEPVGGRQLGLVVQPHVHVEPLLVVQLGIAHVQQSLGAEPVPAFPGPFDFLETDSHPLHAVAGRPDDVELVDDNRHTGEHVPCHVPIGAPHIDSHTPDVAAVPEVVQPCGQRTLVPVGQHVHGLLGPYVRQHQPHLPVDLGLVDAKPSRQPGLVVRFQPGDVLGGQVAHRLVVAPYILGNPHKGVPQAERLDVVGAPLRHPALGLDATQRLEKRLPAGAAAVSLDLGPQSRRVAPHWAVQVGDWFGAVPVQLAYGSALLAGRRLYQVLGIQNVGPVFGRLGDDCPAGQVENVGHPRIVVWNKQTSGEQLGGKALCAPCLPGVHPVMLRIVGQMALLTHRHQIGWLAILRNMVQVGDSKNHIDHAVHLVVAHVRPPEELSGLVAEHLGRVQHVGPRIVAAPPGYPGVIGRLAQLACMSSTLQNDLSNSLPVFWIARLVFRFDGHCVGSFPHENPFYDYKASYRFTHVIPESPNIGNIYRHWP